MTTLLSIMFWCILFVLCWPLAVFALLLWPLVWLLVLPFRLLGIAFNGILALIQAVILLPARLLGWRPNAAGA